MFRPLCAHHCPMARYSLPPPPYPPRPAMGPPSPLFAVYIAWPHHQLQGGRRRLESSHRTATQRHAPPRPQPLQKCFPKERDAIANK